MSKLIKFLSVLIINYSLINIYAAESPPAKSLLALFNSNTEFAKQWDKTIANLHPMPDGTPNIWTGKTQKDLIKFIEHWLVASRLHKKFFLFFATLLKLISSPPPH